MCKNVGIPDYRSDKGLYSTSKSRPMDYSEFVKSSLKRRTYWARNFVSWQTFSALKPNTGLIIFLT
jgi:NAD+-dependent protein deacetylase sirtuin 4